jgi:hypothetical protein
VHRTQVKLPPQGGQDRERRERGGGERRGQGGRGRERERERERERMPMLSSFLLSLFIPSGFPQK